MSLRCAKRYLPYGTVLLTSVAYATKQPLWLLDHDMRAVQQAMSEHILGAVAMLCGACLMALRTPLPVSEAARDVLLLTEQTN